MKSIWRTAGLVGLVAVMLSGCALGERRAAVENMLQFESVDTDGNGVISRAEWDSVMAKLPTRRR